MGGLIRGTLAAINRGYKDTFISPKLPDLTFVRPSMGKYLLPNEICLPSIARFIERTARQKERRFQPKSISAIMDEMPSSRIHPLLWERNVQLVQYYFAVVECTEITGY